MLLPFLKLTTVEGAHVWVNMGRVQELRLNFGLGGDTPTGTRITMNTVGEHLSVGEMPDEILAKMKSEMFPPLGPNQPEVTLSDSQNGAMRYSPGPLGFPVSPKRV